MKFDNVKLPQYQAGELERLFFACLPSPDENLGIDLQALANAEEGDEAAKDELIEGVQKRLGELREMCENAGKVVGEIRRRAYAHKSVDELARMRSLVEEFGAVAGVIMRMDQQVTVIVAMLKQQRDGEKLDEAAGAGAVQMPDELARALLGGGAQRRIIDPRAPGILGGPLGLRPVPPKPR